MPSESQKRRKTKDSLPPSSTNDIDTEDNPEIHSLPAAYIKDQEKLLPVANVARIMKETLPPYAKLSKEAKEYVQECASEFIAFVTSEALDYCKSNKRKTVTGEDVIQSMKLLDFESYADVLTIFLNRLREDMRHDKKSFDFSDSPQPYIDSPSYNNPSPDPCNSFL